MSLKILLADDNITAQKMGSKILTDAGYTVVAVSNGAAAMKKIAAEKPELMILDVYMPGYTGLEVCEKVKNAAATAATPVVLTVTNMEPFNPEDGNKVKADGVLIKPFEATDLLAVVKKFEEKLQAAAPAEAAGVKTVKMEAVQEFEDASYAEWKAEAAPEEPAPKPVELPQEVASAPALGLEELGPAEPAPAEAAPAAEFGLAVEAPPPAEPSPAPFAIEAQPEPAPAFDLSAPAPGFDLTREPAAEAVIAPPPELEFTSAPQAAAAEVAVAPELELTQEPSAPEAPIAPDAALVTDRSDMAQFATKFGEEHPEEVPVGIAMPEPGPDEVLEPLPTMVEHAAPVAPPAPAVFEAASGAAVAVAPALEPVLEIAEKTQKLEAVPEPEETQLLEVVAEPAPAEPPAEAVAAPEPVAKTQPMEAIMAAEAADAAQPPAAPPPPP